MLSTRQAPNVVENYLKEELELGRVVKLSSFPGPLNADLFFGKKQYTCWGGSTAVQPDLYLLLVKKTA